MDSCLLSLNTYIYCIPPALALADFDSFICSLQFYVNTNINCSILEHSLNIVLAVMMREMGASIGCCVSKFVSV